MTHSQSSFSSSLSWIRAYSKACDVKPEEAMGNIQNQVLNQGNQVFVQVNVYQVDSQLARADFNGENLCGSQQLSFLVCPRPSLSHNQNVCQSYWMVKRIETTSLQTFSLSAGHETPWKSPDHRPRTFPRPRSSSVIHREKKFAKE